jgi:hypothetical protein
MTHYFEMKNNRTAIGRKYIVVDRRKAGENSCLNALTRVQETVSPIPPLNSIFWPVCSK